MGGLPVYKDMMAAQRVAKFRRKSLIKSSIASEPETSRYPQPSEHGGRLIRKVIAELKAQKISLPIASDILIAISGGSDSLALAHLLLKYGRRVADPTHIKLLHINHGWRSGASEADAEFVKRFGRQWGAEVIVHELEPPKDSQMKGRSWEEVARYARKGIFEKEAARLRAKVLTAHQADDLAETVLWRLLTGAAETHAGGIAFAHGVEMRPLLSVRKQELKAYLEEERQTWCEDSTNYAGRFMRSKMRLHLMPVIDDLFPRAVEHLVALARKAAKDPVADPDAAEAGVDLVAALLGASGVRLKRSHWSAIEARLRATARKGALALPGGWRLSRETT
jgi:tRNA(Ile)-lysidine synthase